MNQTRHGGQNLNFFSFFPFLEGTERYWRWMKDEDSLPPGSAMEIATVFLSLLLPLALLLLSLSWKSHKEERTQPLSGRLRLRLPPGPISLPVIGNLHQLSGLPHRSLHRLASLHGPLIRLRLGSIQAVVASSADAARDVLKTHDHALGGRAAGAAAQKLSYGCRDIFFTSNGDYWKQMRRICVQEILSYQKVQSFRAIREEEVSRMIQRISETCSHGPVNVSELLLRLTNGMICSAALGSKYGGSGTSGGRFHGILGEAQAAIIGFGVADFFPSLRWIDRLIGFERRLDEIFRSLDSFFEEVIEEHLDPRTAKPEREDFVHVLLRVQREEGDGSSFNGVPLTRDHIKAIIMDMFLAGTDTNFATLTWGMTELMKNPQIREKAQQEVRRIAGGKETIDEVDVHQMEYLHLVLKEVLRLHPPTPIIVPRVCREHCQIFGFDILPETRVFVNLWAVMRDPQLWENPEEFRPERFAGAGVGGSPFDFKGQNPQFIPFGCGRRICPGASFAEATAELALASLLHRFDWGLPEGMGEEDIDMEEVLGLALHKKTALRLVATPVRRP